MKCTKREFSDLIGFGTSFVQQLIDEGMPHEQKKGRGHAGTRYEIETKDAIPWILKRFKARNKDRPVKEVLQHEQARRVALDNAEKMGLLVKFDEVNTLFTSTISMLANELEGLPGRLANELSGISDPGRIRARLLEEHRRVRTNLAKRLRLEAEHSEDEAISGEAVEPTANPKRGRLGKGQESPARRKRRTG